MKSLGTKSEWAAVISCAGLGLVVIAALGALTAVHVVELTAGCLLAGFGVPGRLFTWIMEHGKSHIRLEFTGDRAITTVVKGHPWWVRRQVRRAVRTGSKFSLVHDNGTASVAAADIDSFVVARCENPDSWHARNREGD